MGRAGSRTRRSGGAGAYNGAMGEHLRGLVGALLGTGIALSGGAAQAAAETVPIPGLRLDLGAHFLLPQPDGQVAADPLALPDRGPRFALSLQFQVAVLRFTRGNELAAVGLFPEIGYAYQARDLGTTSLFNLGLGLGGMPSPWVYAAYIPRLVAGRVYGADDAAVRSSERYRSAIGLRHGLLVGVAAGILHVEISHQYLSIGGRPQHEMLTMLGIDVLRVAIAGLLLGSRR